MTPILARADLHDSLVSGDALLLVDGLVDWLALLLINQLVVKRKSQLDNSIYGERNHDIQRLKLK